jgi:hypothetical protein
MTRKFSVEELDQLEQGGHTAFAAEVRRLGLVDVPVLQLSAGDVRGLPADIVVRAQEAGMLDGILSGSLQRDLSWAKERFAAGEADLVAAALADGELTELSEHSPREWHALLAEHAPKGSWTQDQIDVVADAAATVEAHEAGLLDWADTFGWRTAPGEDQILSAREYEHLSPQEVVDLQEQGRLDWHLGIGGYDRAAEPPQRADDPLFAQHADQIASGAAAPEYNAAGQLVGIRTSPDAISAYERLGGFKSDPNAAAWKSRHAEQSKPSLRRWQPPAEGAQWGHDDVVAATPEQMVAAEERGDLREYLGLA